MSIESVEKILSKKLSDDWGSRTPIFWDNSEDSPVRGISFIRPTIEGVNSEIVSSKCQKEYYLFTVQVFTPFGRGSGDTNRLSDELAKIFFGYSEEYLTCLNTVVDRIGQDQEWHQNNVVVDLIYYNHF